MRKKFYVEPEMDVQTYNIKSIVRTSLDIEDNPESGDGGGNGGGNGNGDYDWGYGEVY